VIESDIGPGLNGRLRCRVPRNKNASGFIQNLRQIVAELIDATNARCGLTIICAEL